MKKSQVEKERVHKEKQKVSLVGLLHGDLVLIQRLGRSEILLDAYRRLDTVTSIPELVQYPGFRLL